MILNVSQLLDWQKCPVFWHHKHVSKRGYAGGAALSDGLYWHALAEAWLKGESLLPQSFNPVQDFMRHFVEEGRLPKFPTVSVEKALAMPLGSHTLVGIPDGIMPLDETPCPNCQGDGMHCFVGPCSNCSGSGKVQTYYSLQWKTCSGNADIERQCEAVKFSYHEAAYEALMNHNGYPCAGTYLGVWKKLTKGEQMAGVYPLHFFVLERPKEYVQQIMGELETWANIISPMPGLIPNRRSCIQGFIRCPYFDTCYNNVPLSDARYIDVESRYEKEEST